jgi:hypothetical protein
VVDRSELRMFEVADRCSAEQLREIEAVSQIEFADRRKDAPTNY